MEMIPVDSSAIEAIGYDPATRQLCIRFKEGRAYDFCGVPAEVYRALRAARSKGTYYAEHIRGRYEC